MEKRTILFEALKFLNETEFQNIGYMPITKEKLKSVIYKSIEPLTRGIYSDNSWKTIHMIFNAIQKIVDFDILESEYDKKNHPPTYKQWKIQINYREPKNPEKMKTMHGTITAHGAGSVNDPLDKYDVTVVIN